MNDSPQRKGGHARAEKLTPDARSNIASSAAKARWAVEKETPPPRATHRGELRIGSAIIPCAVLDDGRRVISEHGITTALGSRSGASKRKKKASGDAGAPLPIFIAPGNLKPFIDNDLVSGPLNPITYRDGRRAVIGYEATILPAICDVWLRARAAEALMPQQLDRAQKAEELVRGLANVGVIALVDEATGYQQDRERDELHKLLAVYLSEERLKWAKRFPDEFYRQLYRLRGWSWPTGHHRTPFVGKLTNQLVYDQLPPGVLEELQLRNPTNPVTQRRPYKHHQYLSADIGVPDLRDHLLQLIAIMRASPNWSSFERNFARAFDVQGQLDID